MSAPDSYLQHGRGLWSWLGSVDHKRIGILFLIATTMAMVIGGMLAMMIRTEHLTPDETIMSANAYNRTFTAHGIIMVWLFLIPSIPTAFGNFLLPLMIGAKEVAFPRLNRASLWVFIVGALWVLFALAWTHTDTGWTFYTPYSTKHAPSVIPVALGIVVVGISSIMTSINFVVTTHTMRMRGLRWFRMPLFVWTIYATAIIQLLATPVLTTTLFLIAGDAGFGWGLFDPSTGGDPLLYQQLFWFYSHPAVYIMILPAMGVISEIVCTFSSKPPASYQAIVWSSLGIAFIGFLTWGHHMFVAGQSGYNAATFGILSQVVAVFSAIKVFTWVATMRGGAVRMTTPMLYVFGFLFLFVFGGLTGVAQATVALDVHWHDTYFVVAHFHYIMVGGSLSGLFGALYYWFPKLSGRLYHENLGRLGALLIVAGFMASFTPQFLLGNAGMPRRYHVYADQHQVLNVLSTLGSYMLASGVLIALLTIIVAWRWGRRAPANPWDSAGYEWRVASPPPPHNYPSKPAVDPSPYDYGALEARDD